MRKGKMTMKSFLAVSAVIFAALLMVVLFVIPKKDAARKEALEAQKAIDASVAAAAETTAPAASYQIEGIPIVSQKELMAGCETYACTMLLQYLGFDTDEFEFSENYLICSPISYDEDGNRYGPDMYSAFAGTVDNGYGIYSPAMAKSMNNFFKDKNSNLKATSVTGETLASLCETYIKNGTPVMVWATTYMQEPYEKASWIVDYTDENAVTKEGDTFTWLQNEHCMVLCGFDDNKYYMCDSVAGKVSEFDKKTAEERFAQLGSQAIVVI